MAIKVMLDNVSDLGNGGNNDAYQKSLKKVPENENFTFFS